MVKNYFGFGWFPVLKLLAEFVLKTCSFISEICNFTCFWKFWQHSSDIELTRSIRDVSCLLVYWETLKPLPYYFAFIVKLGTALHSLLRNQQLYLKIIKALKYLELDNILLHLREKLALVQKKAWSLYNKNMKANIKTSTLEWH